MYDYSEVLPIEAYKSTVWLIEEEYPTAKRTFLSVWHDKAKIEDIVNFFKRESNTGVFTVAALNVGTFEVSKILHALSNGRKVNQDLKVVV